GLRLTAYSAPRVRWCYALVAKVAAYSVGPEQEHLPFSDTWEPLLIFGGRDDKPGLPLAALVVWRPDAIEVAVGAAGVFTIAKAPAAHLCLREEDLDPSQLMGRELTLEDMSRFTGGELDLRLPDGSRSPYLGYAYCAGQLLVLASPEIPWSE